MKLGGYCNPDGSEYSKVKVRLHIDGQKKTRFLWDQNTPGEPIPCGLHRLGEARSAGYLFIGEGESDAATMWFHGFPYLGISGASSVKRLDVSLLDGIPRIYLIEEPDQAQKLSETGLGFYASMREHLRTNGYEGEILSIRFKLATGYKDPSEMHKTIYRRCDQSEEAPHLAEIKAKFADALFAAMELAIPEGNTSLATQEDFEADPPPPLPDSDSDRLSWVKELNSVPTSTMSAAHKIVLQTIMLHSPIWHSQDGQWWQVDAYHLCTLAGMTKDQFLTHLAYLTNVLGLFIKHLDREWVTDEKTGKPTVKASVLSIKPSPVTWLTYPSTYKVVDGAPERKPGGKRIPNPSCTKCGSENITVYEAHYCRDCKHLHIVRDDQEEQAPVESTAQVLPIESEPILLKSQNDFDEVSPETDTSETPKDPGNIYIYRDQNIQLPEVSPEPSVILLKSQNDFDEVSTEALTETSVIHTLHAEKGDPCPRCGCPLYHKDHWCCRCFPRGFPDDIWRWLNDQYAPSKREELGKSEPPKHRRSGKGKVKV